MSVTAAAAVSSGSGAGQQIGAHNVFVYGSLLADDVVRVLLNRVPQSSPAILHDLYVFGALSLSLSPLPAALKLIDFDLRSSVFA